MNKESEWKGMERVKQKLLEKTLTKPERSKLKMEM